MRSPNRQDALFVIVEQRSEQRKQFHQHLSSAAAATTTTVVFNLSCSRPLVVRWDVTGNESTIENIGGRSVHFGLAEVMV